MNPTTQFCHNLDCPARGQVGQGNITIHSQKQGHVKVGPHPRRCGGTSPPSALRLSPAAAGEGEERLPSPIAMGEG